MGDLGTTEDCSLSALTTDMFSELYIPQGGACVPLLLPLLPPPFVTDKLVSLKARCNRLERYYLVKNVG